MCVYTRSRSLYKALGYFITMASVLAEQPLGSANLAVKVTLKGGTLKLKNHHNNVKDILGNKAGGGGNGGNGNGHQSNQQPPVSSQPSLLGSSASGSNGNQRVVSRTGKGALRKLSVCVCNPLAPAPAPAPAPCSTETSEKQEKHKSGNSQQGKGKQHNNQQQQQRRNTCTGNNSQRSTVDASAGKPATKPVIEDDWLESMNTTSTTRTRKATKGTKLAPPGLGAPPGLKLPPPTTTQVPESTSSQGRRSDVASPATPPPQQSEHGARPTSDGTSNSKKSTAQAEIPPSSGNAAQASAAEQHPFPSHGEDDVSTLMLEQQAQRLLKEKSEAVANADALARRVAQLEEQVRWLSASQDDDDVPWLDDDEDNEDDEDDGACTAPRDLQ